MNPLYATLQSAYMLCPRGGSVAKRGQHVIHSNGYWSVRRAGSSRASGLYETQAEAVQAATRIAKNQQTELYIYGRDGLIRERRSYEPDPRAFD